jgi:hypothetical protein
MESTSRDDMRKLLKTFGIRADEAVIAYLARNPQMKALRIRLALEDLTDYGGISPGESLAFELEGEIGRTD